MNRKEKKILAENALLERIYNLILNEQTSEDERKKLVSFKDEVGDGKDFQEQIIKLAEELRKLALCKFKDKKNLSPEVGKLYMDISSTGFIKKEFGGGLVSLSF